MCIDILCTRDNTKAVKVMKLDKDKLKTVLEISNVIIAYPETAEYIENDMVKICLMEKWWVEEVFYFVVLV